MLERPKFFIDILATGLDILFLDADVVFFNRSPLEIADENVDVVFSSDSREFFTNSAVGPFADERRRGEKMPPVCNGIFWMKSSPATLQLWQDTLDVFQDPIWRVFRDRFSDFGDDQRAMDVLLNGGRAGMVPPLPEGVTEKMLQGRYDEEWLVGGLKKRILDQVEVVSGHLLVNRRKEYLIGLERLGKKGGERLAAHFNWDIRDLTKEEGVREVGMWWLDGEGRCTS